MSTEFINQLIEKACEKSILIRRKIHENPELGTEEKETQGVIISQLEALGIPYEKDLFGYGVKAVIKGKDESRAIAIRADMDALPVEEETSLPFKSKVPGKMHACGHDVHVACLLGAAEVLSEISDELPMSVTLIFQPSEETIGGAKQMIDAGCMKNPEVMATIGLHINPAYDFDKLIIVPGTMNAATSEFHVKVNGKSCHGAHPDSGVDPLIPACNMIISLQSILTRRLHPASANLITVGRFNSGTKENVIPDYTTFSGTIRVLDMDNLFKIQTELKRLCESIAIAHGATCEISFSDGYPTLVNNQEMLDAVASCCREKMGEDTVIINPVPSLGADDFAYFCHESKGLYIDFGSKSPEDAPMNLHSPSLIVDERCIETGISTEVYSILKLMEVM